MVRCVSCDTVMNGHPGYVEVEVDGVIKLFEDDMCSLCRAAAMERDSVGDRQYTQGHISEYFDLMFPDGVTPSVNSEY